MNKKITVYYAKDADEAARIQAVLQANGIERSRWRKRRKHRPGPPSMPGALEKKLRKNPEIFPEKSSLPLPSFSSSSFCF